MSSSDSLASQLFMHFPGAWLLMRSLTIGSQTEAAFQETMPLSSHVGIGLSPAEAQAQVPAEAAADDAREPRS